MRDKPIKSISAPDRQRIGALRLADWEACDSGITSSSVIGQLTACQICTFNTQVSKYMLASILSTSITIAPGIDINDISLKNKDETRESFLQQRYLLDHGSFDLFDCFHVYILHHQNKYKGQWQKAHSCDAQSAHDVSIGQDNALPHRTAHWVLQLSGDAAVDDRRLRLGIIGEILLQSARHEVGINRRRHGLADGTPNAGKQSHKGQHDGHFVVCGRRHNSHLFANNERSSRHGNDYLAHNHVSDALVRLTEIDHQAGSEDLEGNGRKGDIFEVASRANHTVATISDEGQKERE